MPRITLAYNLKPFYNSRKYLSPRTEFNGFVVDEMPAITNHQSAYRYDLISWPFLFFVFWMYSSMV
jgi:hypothetical protein